MRRQTTLGAALLAAAIVFIMTSSAAGAVIHVKWDSPGPTFDGNSWETAYHAVHEGLDAAVSGDEVWVAAGTYVENITLKNGVGLYGGFAGTEAAREQRDWRLNDTVIEGGGSGSAVGGANLSTIDGFIIRNGRYGVGCYHSSPTITNNTIVGSSYDGIYCDSSSPTITNNTILGNTEDGIYCHSGSPTITNNTIVGNGGYGVYSGSGSPTITNNIVTFNTTGIRSSEVAAPVLSHNDVYGNWTDYDGISPGTGDISVDPEFACCEQWDFHIQSTSLCRDAGDNSAPGLPDTDMDGQARNDGGGVDIGADESYGEQWPPCPELRVIHVDQSASVGGDGTSWANAYQTIGDAVDDVLRNGGAEIWVAQGVYSENVRLMPFAHMYGGFAGMASQRSKRDWRNNVTVIDGAGSENVVTGANISTIDGFSVRNGRYGIYCRSSFLTITNNTILGNSYDSIYCSYSSPTITNNTVLGNSYGVDCYHSSPTITNNTIIGNGGGICSRDNSSPTITNNTIVGNSGNGIYCYSGSPTITNNIVAFNTTGVRRNEGAAPVLSHNDVYGNETDYDGLGPGVGDISEDPEFACWEQWDFHIQPASPCRDAGDNSEPGLPDADMDGQTRDDGGGVDIGADESYGEQWPPCPGPRIIHVDRSASAGGDGTTWTNAYQTIGDAVGDVMRSGGAEIWVAEGVYNENVRLVPFAYLYGGFAGTESERSERDWRNNVTVIDGGRRGVVTGANISTIDGFTIRRGGEGHGIACGSTLLTITNNRIIWNRIGIGCYSGSPTIANNTISGNSYGIWCNQDSSPTITNNIISGSSSVGIYCFDNSSPTITNNMVVRNYRRAIYCRDNASPTITNNTISGNWWIGICCEGNSSPIITNNTILGNTDDGISCSGSTTITNNTIAGNTRNGISCSGSSTVTNNTIVGNSENGIYCRSGSPTVTNNIVAFNTTGICRNEGAASLLSHNDVYGNTTDYDGLSPGAGDISEDPEFAFWEQWDFHIQPASPCRDAGDNSAPGLPDTDMDGQPRDDGGGVDIGADESYGEQWPPCPGPRIVYVDGSASPGGDGTSWATAYQTIGEATHDAWLSQPAEIWVAEGVYTENVALAPLACLYGGFAGIESQRDERDWRNNVTVIDGGGSGDVVSCFFNLSTIDGFVIRNGSHGICCNYSSPTITNNTILGNAKHGIGCGWNSSPTITNNTIAGNSRDGICCDDGSPAITNNTIAGNSGSGIDCYRNSSTTVTNNTIVGNTRDGISCSGSSTVTNNTIVGNSENGIYCRFGSPTVTNNIVAFNTTGICRNEGAASVLSHNDVYGNTTDYDGLSPGAGDISEDPEFACWEQWDFHIQPASPCRDAGDNSAPGLPGTDMEGQPRDDGGGVDIGADESYGEQWPPCPELRIIHVDWSASAGGDGTTWASAYQTIGDAVDDVLRNGGAEVWVAEGIYSENVSLVPFAHMYGGFAGIESQSSERNWRNNVTVIDGAGSDNVVTGANMSTIDGFTIRNGRRGIYYRCGSATITNNTIIGNSGSGISCYYGSPTITNNTISGNSDSGIYCRSSSPTITNNTIVGNSEHGISCYYHSSPTIANNTIAGNSRDGIYCYYYSSPTMANNTIVGNSDNGIYCYRNSSPTVTNNIVAFNTTGIYNDKGGPVLSHNDVYGNTEYDYLGLSPGVGDISLDPLFADPVGGDYHLRFDSPCIDAGTNEDAPSEDADGNPRPVDGNSDGLAVADIGAYEYQPIPVQMDVLPGDDANVIRLKGNRMIPVAILSDAVFDARNIVPASVLFGPGCAQEVHGRGHWEDVNRDGLVDLLLHFSCGESGIGPGDESVSLCGWTVGGERVAGSDSIRVIAR